MKSNKNVEKAGVSTPEVAVSLAETVTPTDTTADSTTNNTAGTTTTPTPTEPEAPVWLVRTLTVLAYGIPLAFLAYVLYINYLPFGYNKTFTIDVGAEGDTNSSNAFYLEPSPDLSERKTDENGNTYRELNGMANVIFKPNTVLKNANLTTFFNTEDVELVPPLINFDPNKLSWSNSWNFKDGVPSDLVGNAFLFDGCVTFANDTRLEFPNSADLFEANPFSVYAKWIPKDSSSSFQQIIGHYNWEISQYPTSVKFQIGEMDATNTSGIMFYNVSYPISKEFFNTEHELLAEYVPSSEVEKSGYIQLYVDNKLAGRKYFGERKIRTDYWDKSLSFGKNWHENSSNFNGCITEARINPTPTVKIPSSSFSISTTTRIQFVTHKSIILKTISVNVKG